GARMAALPPGQTLQATALVHEAYMKLVGDPQARFENRAHFFGAAARAMRNVLVDEYRAKSRVKRGGDRDRVPLDVSLPDPGADVDLLALHEALERLEQQDAEKAEIVMLRYFAGLTVPEVAKTTGLSVATVERRWSFAKAWLLREVRKGDS
ncbi:MAG: ECF-type sigma factor, partial [Planctomycetota bacterium]